MIFFSLFRFSFWGRVINLHLSWISLLILRWCLLVSFTCLWSRITSIWCSPLLVIFIVIFFGEFSIIINDLCLICWSFWGLVTQWLCLFFFIPRFHFLFVRGHFHSFFLWIVPAYDASLTFSFLLLKFWFSF